MTYQPSSSSNTQGVAPAASSSARCRCPRIPKAPLYVQVIVAIALATLVGGLWPEFCQHHWMQAIGTGFVKMIKMVIAPIIFCTIVPGISHAGAASKVGGVALKAIIYFELVSTFALGLGLVVGNLVRPGEGFDAPVDPAETAQFEKDSKTHSTVEFLLHLIPPTVVSPFAEGNILQVLHVSVLFGFALMAVGERAKPVLHGIEAMSHCFFGMITIIMRFAPFGAFAAMAYTVGKYGLGTLGSLFVLVMTFYVTCIGFVALVLAAIAACARFNIFRFLWYLKEELLVVFATSSSEAALPTLLEKLEAAGCSDSVVGLVVPLGYSFNLDGTNIYMSLATLFIAQAMGVPLTLGEQLRIIGVAMLTSKGATGVSGAGFITLASTLSAVRPELVPGMAFLLGVDKFMSECRSLTNIIGNAVAAVVISSVEGELDRDRLDQVLRGHLPRTQSKDSDVEGDHGEEHSSPRVYQVDVV